MSPLLLFSIALVIGSLIGSVVLWVKSAETRVGVFGGLFLVFAVHQGIELWSHWGAPFAFDASATTAVAVAGVIEGVLSVCIVVALSRTLGERDHVEAIHWDSMETVRVMNELTTDDAMTFDEKIAKLLAAGKKRYGMEVGMVARVSEAYYEVLAVDSPEDFAVASGAVLSLGETFCESTIDSERPIGIERIAKSGWNSRLDGAAFAFDSYLGVAVRVGGIPYGTLSFASSKPHKERFTATDKDLIRLMALWMGSQIEKRDGIHIYIEEPQAEGTEESQASETGELPESKADRIVGAPPRTHRQAPASPRNRTELDANQILKRLQKQLRGILGDEITLNLKLDPGLGLALVSRAPIDAIVRTLVLNAKDAMTGGGQLVIETANLELVANEPGVMPAVAPDQYVTIAVRDTGTEPNAHALSRLYDRSPASDDLSDPRARLALSSIYRILQNCGGDLSVDAEQGLGSTFTIYLPRARRSLMADAPPSTQASSASTTH